jgi:Cu+-exporting ATPase
MRRAEFYFAATIAVKSFRPKLNPPHRELRSKAVYTCPMHPEVQSEQPGDCPKCGMALDPENVSAVAEENP